MARTKEIDNKVLEVTAIIAGDFQPSTEEVIEYTREFAAKTDLASVNEVFKAARCITGLSLVVDPMDDKNSIPHLKGLRTMMPGPQAQNCERVGCSLIASCAMALFALNAESAVRQRLKPGLDSIIHIRI